MKYFLLNRSAYFYGLGLSVLVMLVGMYMTFVNARPIVQYAAFTYSIICGSFLLLGYDRIGSTIFSLILFTIFFLGTMWFINLVIYAFTTEPNAVIEGKAHRVMDMRWLWGMGIGLFTGLSVVYTYYKKKLSEPRIELLISVLFVLTIGLSMLY